MKRLFPAATLALLFAVPAPPPANLPRDLAETRLRGCLLAGASSAEPAAGLQATIIRVRAFCAPQIKRAQDMRVLAATGNLTGNAAREAKTRTIRQLNDEIARVIASFSGLNH